MAKKTATPEDVEIADSLPPPVGKPGNGAAIAANPPPAPPAPATPGPAGQQTAPVAGTAPPPPLSVAPALVPAFLMQKASDAEQWALQQAAELGTQLVGAAPDAETAGKIQQLLQRLVLNGLHVIVQQSPAELGRAKEERALILFALKNLGVVGEKTVEDIAKKKVAQVFVDAADFVLQGALKLGL